MAYTIGELVWKITGDTSGIDKSLKHTESSSTGLGNAFNGVMGKMAGAIGIYKVAEKIYEIGKASLKASADMETQRVAITTLLGSAAKAQVLIADLSKFAASTPFAMTEVVDASKKLLAFGESAGTITTTLRRIGDVAAGLSIPLGDLVEVYGKARVQNTLYAEDLNQLAGRGIPIFSELGKIMNVSASEIKKMGSEGKITFSDLEKVFKNMTSAGGQFSGLMEAQSKTFNGQWSNLNDSIEQAAILMGDRLLPYAKGLTVALSSVVETYKEYLELTKYINDNQSKYISLTDMALASATDVNDKLVEIWKQGGKNAEYAALYAQYLQGDVKLNDKQIKQIEQMIGLNRSLGDIQFQTSMNELESWKQRGMIIDKIAEKKPDKNKEAEWLKEYIRVHAEAAKLSDEINLSETEKITKEYKKRLDEVKRYYVGKKDTAEVKEKAIADLTKKYNEDIRVSEQKSLADRIGSFNGYVQQIGGAVLNLASSFKSLFDAIGQAQLDQLDARMEAELEAAGVSEETSVEQAQREYDAAVATGNALDIEEKRRALVKSQIEEKYQKEKSKLEYENALRSWEFQRAIAALQIPLAIMNAVASGAQAPWFLQPGFMIGMGLTAGVAATAQYAAVEASKPAPPKFFDGGIIPGSSQGTTITAGENNQTEIVMNPNQMANTLMAISKGTGGGSGVVQLPPISEASLWKMIFEASQNGDLFISERAVTNK